MNDTLTITFTDYMEAVDLVIKDIGQEVEIEPEKRIIVGILTEAMLNLWVRMKKTGGI